MPDSHQRLMELERAVIEQRRSAARVLTRTAVSKLLAGAASVEEAAARVLRIVWENLGRSFGSYSSVEAAAGILRLPALHNAAILPDDRQRVGADIRRTVESCGSYRTSYRIHAHGHAPMAGGAR